MHQSCSSTETTPQEEDRIFDISDSESLSEDGNASPEIITIQRRGIVNPNYPGFQHLAHTLDYTIKIPSDTDLTDDDIDCEQSYNNANNLQKTIDNDNNNNNDQIEEEDTDYHLDHIDSVNRLDSVENIQKVFYDKPVFNNLVESGEAEEEEQNCNDEDAINPLNDLSDEEKSKPNLNLFKAVEQDLEEAVEKLSITKDLTPTATRYNIEPNVEEPFKNTTEMAATVHLSRNFPQPKLKETFNPDFLDIMIEKDFRKNYTFQDEIKAFKDEVDSYNHKLTDAFLSGIHDKVEDVDKKRFEETSNETMKCNDDVEMSTNDEVEKFCKEDKTKDDKEKDEDSAVPRKKEKMEISHVKKRRDYNQQIGSLITFPRRETIGRNHHHHHHHRDNFNRRSVPMVAREKKKTSPEILGKFLKEII